VAFFLDWYDAGGNLISSEGGPIDDPNGPLTYQPYSQIHFIDATAPANAATAGVRLESGNPAYNGLAADHFDLTLVPEPAGAALASLGGWSLTRFRRRRCAA
jgi:hypothetical protein